MNSAEFLDYELEMLRGLVPPLEAYGLGGSSGRGSADALSDLDFFLLVPDKEFFAFVQQFPGLIRHPWPPIAWRRRGFVPDFGFQFSAVFENLYSVDYHVNCHSSLRRTPMARKTQVIFDNSGLFTEFHRALPDSSLLSREEYAADAAAEVLIELQRLHKYVCRGELLSVLHRFERLRLVMLGLERYLRGGEPYSPHDADKWMARDLTAAVNAEVAATFSVFDWKAAAASFTLLHAGVSARLAEVTEQSPAYRSAIDRLAGEIVDLMATGSLVPHGSDE